MVYALFIGKKANDYNKFFEQLLLKHNYEPESILIDFENATLKSTKAMFSDAIQLVNFELYAFFSKTNTVAMNLGCFFFCHFGQCIWHEIQSLDPKNKYINDEKFRINMKKLMDLVCVPVFRCY